VQMMSRTMFSASVFRFFCPSRDADLVAFIIFLPLVYIVFCRAICRRL
jgi:hypothetical protein